jgi:hypothetical protein
MICDFILVAVSIATRILHWHVFILSITIDHYVYSRDALADQIFTFERRGIIMNTIWMLELKLVHIYSHEIHECVARAVLESLSSTSNTNTDTYVFTSVLILVPGILKR